MIEPSLDVQPQVVVDVPLYSLELGRMLLGTKPLVEIMHDVCRLAVESLPGVDEVSITLLEDGWSQTVAFTGSLAATLDERQHAAGFGPCLDAAHGGGVARVDDTTSDTAYPDFAAVAARQGVTSVLALALPMPTRVLGALTLYRLHGTQPFSAQTQAAAAAFGACAAVVLANAAALGSLERLLAHAQAAMASRSVIEQAKGVIMSFTACDADEAFRSLAVHSQRTNRKLRDIAAEVVAAAEHGQQHAGSFARRLVE